MKQVVYVASPESKQLYVWSLHNTGKLTLLQELILPHPGQTIQISHDGKYLYLGVRDECSIITYLISDEGKLTKKAITKIPSSPTYMIIDHYNKWLFIASYHGNQLMVLPIDAEGIVHSVIQIIDHLQHPHAVGISFDKQYLLVPCLREDIIRIFVIGYNKNPLKEHSFNSISTKKGAGPRHLVFHPYKDIFYCVNELDATIGVYNFLKTYRQVEKYNIIPVGLKNKPWAADIHITPDGYHLYASERSTSIIRHFQVISDGLQLLPIESYATEIQPRGFNIDNAGNFLLVVGQKSNHISVYKINPVTGFLEFIERYLVGKGPMWIAIHTL
ncbi:6-phosphogluconolactonase [Arsenophonus symbiont of Ornithomya chloropus]|uniref:6-phosphogluconolactonase n=1 Tax=Arsenophonus symbiont of Ornithomya chloropus TaxID=634121 RepID=UPI0032B24114